MLITEVNIEVSPKLSAVGLNSTKPPRQSMHARLTVCVHSVQYFVVHVCGMRQDKDAGRCSTTSVADQWLRHIGERPRHRDFQQINNSQLSAAAKILRPKLRTKRAATAGKMTLKSVV